MKLTSKLLRILQIRPKFSLLDEDITISAKNLLPNSPVRLSLHLTNDHDLDYVSSTTTFKTDARGHLDLSSDKALSLFWHLQPTDNKLKRFWTTDVTKPYKCNFRIEDSAGKIDNETITKYLMHPQVKRVPINTESVKGTLFLPHGDGPFPAVISMYGGMMKGRVIEERSALLASKGFASLALAYFGLEGLPKDYKHLRLDYFEQAIDFLWDHKNIDTRQGIGVVGISKSAEIALLMGTYFSEKVTAVAFMNGLPLLTGYYTYKNRPILKEWRFYDENPIKTPEKDEIVNFAPLFANASNQHESFIPFQESQAKVLFMFGQDDKCVVPAAALDIITQQWNKRQTHCQVLTFPGLGHLIEPPNTPPVSMSNHPLFPRNPVIMGGTNVDLHSLGQIKAWKKLINFFTQNLCN